MNYDLPKAVEIDGEEYAIRYDFRVILEIITMLQDAGLTGEEKTQGLLEIFYLEPESIPDYRAAIDACFSFIDANSGRKQKKRPKLTDWNQDFEYIVAPVNRVLGYECRSIEYDPQTNTGGVHWWTFLAAYMEIGSDCLYSQIISIRDKRQRRKKLEKYEKEWLKRNADIIDLKTDYTESENKLFEEWGKGG